jgi:hypothetical protein
VKCRFPVAVAIAVLLAGTIGVAQKQGRVTETNSTTEYNYPFTTCYAGTADEFVINEKWVEVWRDMTRYDKNEPTQIEQIVRTVRFPTDVLTNSVSGKTLSGGPGLRAEVRVIYENGVPVSIASSGPIIRFNVPGYGHVFIETGHSVFNVVIDDAGEHHLIVSNTGHNDYRDWAPEALEAVCNALK